MGASEISLRSWRGVIRAAGMVTLAVVIAAGSAFAQDPPPQQPAAPAQPDAFTFNNDAMMLFFPVKEAASADFEGVIQKIKELLAKSDKPERKGQAESFQLIRIDAAQNGVVTYAMLIDPVVKGVSYDFGRILAEGMPPEEVKVVFEKLTGSISGQISQAPLRIIIRK